VIDKADFRVPYSVDFHPDFRFLRKEARYAGFCSPAKPSRNYQAVVDLRPFGQEAILHAYFKWGGRKDHKFELLGTGKKSIRQMGEIITSVFDVDPDRLEAMRIDFAADMFSIPVTYLHDSLRVKHKRKVNIRGEFDYEIVGGKRLEYFRYGKSPSCIRVYDKPAECKARMPEILKHVSPDAEMPTYEDLFGFPENTIMARIERQAGGGRIPPVLATFRQLSNAAEFNPFSNVEILPGVFPFPDPKRHGSTRAAKLAGMRRFIEKYGYQQARAMLNCNGNAKRMMDDYEEYLRESKAITEVTVELIVESYRKAVQGQIDGSIEKWPLATHGTVNETGAPVAASA
jgi:hypothetical protein